ncbi:hypothetical protein C8R45DRAFT_1101960 [Mycena sanguinolenta]|nr:hypothetical protein C8R45DRAFT_1101960 [Mycena sanguinolenta]
MPPSAVVDISCNIDSEDRTSTASLISDFSRISPTTYDAVHIAHRNGFTYHLLDSTRPWWSHRLDFSTVTTLHLVDGPAAGVWIVMGHLDRVQTLHLHETSSAIRLEFLLCQA